MPGFLKTSYNVSNLAHGHQPSTSKTRITEESYDDVLQSEGKIKTFELAPDVQTITVAGKIFN